MTETEWNELFALITQVVSLEMTSDECGKLIREKAKRRGSLTESNLAEFCVVAGE